MCVVKNNGIAYVSFEEMLRWSSVELLCNIANQASDTVRSAPQRSFDILEMEAAGLMHFDSTLIGYCFCLAHPQILPLYEKSPVS